MQEEHINLTHEIYSEKLTQIDGREFTYREIDIIACLIHFAQANEIAQFLSIDKRTVSTHIKNIKKTLQVGSTKQILDFVKSSDKFAVFKNEYWLSLCIRIRFEQLLRKFSRAIQKEIFYYEVYHQAHKNVEILANQIKNHLKNAGFTVRQKSVKHHRPLSEIFPNIDEDSLYTIYLLPENLTMVDEANLSERNLDTVSLETNKTLGKIIFLHPQERKTESRNHHLSLEAGTYYHSFFEILKECYPTPKIEKLSSEFKEGCKNLSDELGVSPSQALTEQQKPEAESLLSFIIKYLLTKRRWQIFAGLIFLVCTISISTLFLPKDKEKKEISFSSYSSFLSPIRSDLVLPTKELLLNRSELIAQIDGKFKNNEGIQTIAIVGIGGAGKTTLARQYARSQKLPIVWEINSETQESLMGAFENLAYALAKKEEDQKILREIQDIKDFPERKEKIFYFIKERLKLQGPWLLIYDNVENFSDIQKYFPQDINTWGGGKIILTTRNSNIHNSGSINQMIRLEELNKDQKLTLFTKILNQEKNGRRAQNNIKELMEFLENIPPFPLDISVAAYYLKTANIPYAKYLERLNQDDKSVTTIQETLLKEAGEYTKTRHNITNLSLKQLIETHKDFEDLLLFIALLDSQNIPRELLERLKNDIVVDNFIYHLKKYSLITADSSIPSVGSALSIHRSTQAIALTYLIKTMNLEKRNQSINHIVDILKNYMREARDQEKFSTTKCLLTHCEVLLSHNNLLSDSSYGVIIGELGGLYLLLSDNTNAKKRLKQSLSILENLIRKDPSLLFRPLSYLGDFYWSIGEFTKARTLVEKSIEIYKKFEIADDNGICQTLTWAGMLFANQNDVQKAKDLFTEALKIYEKSPSKNYQGLANSLMNLGNLYRTLGEYNKAEFYLQKSIALSEKYLTNNNPKLGDALGLLGWLYSDLGYLEKAKNLHERVLFIFKQYYPYNNPAVAWALSNLGDAYNYMGDYEKAQIFLNQSIVILKKAFGENNIRTKWTLFQLGKVYINLGDIEIARNILEDCLVVYKKNNSRTRNVLKSLGDLYLLEKNLEKAEDFLNKALETFRNDKSPLEYECLESFLELHLKKSQEAIKSGKLEEAGHFKAQAMNDLKQALAIVRAHFPADSPHIARIQNKIKQLESK